ncbi:hypothetical protein PFISCL1PPCAC_26480, partial [Pristionchus fissidentatus]
LQQVSVELHAALWCSIAVLLSERFLATLFVEDYDSRFNYKDTLKLAAVGALCFVSQLLIRLFVSRNASMKATFVLGTVPSLAFIPSIMVMNRHWARIPMYKNEAVNMTVK